MEGLIRDHENRMLLLNNRQKNYEFLLTEQSQLSEDEHYAIEEVHMYYYIEYHPLTSVYVD